MRKISMSMLVLVIVVVGCKPHHRGPFVFQYYKNDSIQQATMNESDTKYVPKLTVGDSLAIAPDSGTVVAFCTTYDSTVSATKNAQEGREQHADPRWVAAIRIK